LHSPKITSQTSQCEIAWRDQVFLWYLVLLIFVSPLVAGWKLHYF
jgi:hypothetical protein